MSFLRSKILVVTFALLGSAACSKESKTGATHGAGEEPHDLAHAPAGATPGSHEDWCGEHALPESQCTLCNADLVPAFKASGDWCADHGVPKSHCRKCDPSLSIVRPPKSP